MDNNQRIIDGVYVLATDTLHSKWIADTGHLVHDKYLEQKLRPYIKAGDVVLDIGSHYGTHAAMYSTWVGKHGTVHAFEPNKPVFDCLYKNMITRPNVKCHNLGLSDEEGKTGIAHNAENPGASYLTGEGEIPLIRLDNLHLKPNFIKVDAEGFEVKILTGARNTIKAHKPILFIEINRGALERQRSKPEDVYNILVNFGYHYDNITPGEGLSGEQFDIICTPL